VLALPVVVDTLSATLDAGAIVAVVAIVAIVAVKEPLSPVLPQAARSGAARSNPPAAQARKTARRPMVYPGIPTIPVLMPCAGLGIPYVLPRRPGSFATAA